MNAGDSGYRCSALLRLTGDVARGERLQCKDMYSQGQEEQQNHHDTTVIAILWTWYGYFPAA